MPAHGKENTPLRETESNAWRNTKKRAADTDDLLSLGPRKRPSRTDPLVHHGRHFGRTVRTFCRIQALITRGMTLDVQIELGDIAREDLTKEDEKEYRIYHQLLSLSPKLEERLCNGTEEDVFHIADLLTRGSSNARSDDTRSIKAAVIEWITPHGGVLTPPLQRNIKTDRGFHHPRTGELLCPVTLDWGCLRTRERLRSAEIVPNGEQWPLFLYQDHVFDAEDPWKGLLRGEILVKAFKHVFTSPSSVDRHSHRATRSSNSRLHGMKSVTIPSIAYISTQVRFALTTAQTFCRNDHSTDSERFYNSIIKLLEDPEELVKVKQLLVWWDRWVLF
ncbi:hypothetical protein BKA70DRAFT_1369812 [Coprinopsis sp. MPI-PUGE-AT-0042]|nr:hypothetical protein BKA70DRAFT_1369812 [Coprinopsis sp. MPI-PUGE-AT-0042]